MQPSGARLAAILRPGRAVSLSSGSSCTVRSKRSFCRPYCRALNVGDPLDESTNVGPVVPLGDAERVEQGIEEVVAVEAKLLAGGQPRGALLEPTVLTPTQRTLKVNSLDVFVPLVTVEPYDEFEQALGRVNDSAFARQASVLTHNGRPIF